MWVLGCVVLALGVGLGGGRVIHLVWGVGIESLVWCVGIMYLVWCAGIWSFVGCVSIQSLVVVCGS